MAFALALVVFAYAAFVPQYRGGGGVAALPSVLTGSGLSDYAQFTVQTELGALHPYALADRLGAGSMNGATYRGVFGAPGHLVGLDGERPGNVLVQRLGPGNYRSDWGFQTGLVIDIIEYRPCDGDIGLSGIRGCPQS